MQPTLQIEEDYLSVKSMLWSIAHKFSKAHGGDVDDLFSEANVAFCQAYPKWDPEKSKLTTLMYHSIWRRLLTYRQRETKKQGFLFSQSEQTDANDVPDFFSEFSLAEFVEDLSDDARLVVELLFNSPAKMKNQAEEKGGFAKNWGRALRELLQEMCWTGKQIKEAFDEVREALQ